jgi:hypothetical protein
VIVEKECTVGYRVTDKGPGLDPDGIVRFFAVNRPLLSSKLKRLPLRCMAGNGLRMVMGAVAAFNGTIRVTSRGRALTLAVEGAGPAAVRGADWQLRVRPETLPEKARLRARADRQSGAQR